MFLIQLYIILVRNGMFYKKQKSSFLVTIFYYVIDIVYIYSWKTIDKILTHFGDILCKFFFLISHVVFNLTIKWTPREKIKHVFFEEDPIVVSNEAIETTQKVVWH